MNQKRGACAAILLYHEEILPIFFINRGGSVGWEFWIDRGGTFTDIVARARRRRTQQPQALLSENPDRYRDAAVAGIKAILGISSDDRIPAEASSTSSEWEPPSPPMRCWSVRARGRCWWSTAAFPAMSCASAPRRGRRLFDLEIRLPAPLYERAIEVAGRVSVDGSEIEEIDEDAARAGFRMRTRGRP